jgi:predicted phosphodiesterase
MADGVGSRGTATFQYFSDLHLECHAGKAAFVDRLPLEARAPYLIVAGDLGSPRYSNYRRFLERAAALFRCVFVVAGNHEYYHFGGPRDRAAPEWFARVEGAIRSAAARCPNVVFLQNESFEVPGTNVVVYGATLWSDVAPAEELAVTLAVSDYGRIPGFSAEKSRELFRASVARLRSFLGANPEKRVAVVTHHLPSRSLISARYLDSGINSAFASEVELAGRPNVAAWVAGHTHDAAEQGIFHVNPVGYELSPATNLNKTFELAPPPRS